MRFRCATRRLAKAMAANPDGSDATLSHSPTLTLAATRRGEVLGTAAYMSPEQAQGEGVDRRAEVWAFGCCLYEALTGVRAFEGGNASQIMASVLRDEPDWAVLESRAPAELASLLRRCLHKEPRDRFRDIADIRMALQDVAEGPPALLLPPRGRRRHRTWLLSALALAVGLVVGLLASFSRAPATEPKSTAFEISFPDDESFASDIGAWQHVAISPDGNTVVWAGQRVGTPPALPTSPGRLRAPAHRR